MTKPELQRKIKNILNHKNIEKPDNVGAKQGLEPARIPNMLIWK